MSSISSLDGLDALLTETSGSTQALTTEDFLEIMITELTNQDPFEPMKNQDLINQMAGIQQIQSSQNMTESFRSITDRFDTFMGQLEVFLGKDQLSAASKMIGQTITGTTTQGRFAVGKVMAVTMDGDDILLEIDTGESIALENMSRLGGVNSQDIIGTFVAGTTVDNQDVVGVVEALQTDGQNVILRLESGQEVPLSNATIITADTAYLLLGLYVEAGDVQGYVHSYRMTGQEGIAGITLILDTDDEVSLTDITQIRVSQGQQDTQDAEV
ncbi:MAG: hypothetical protein JW810_12080 [Sedimentisphaerales bacterium]|nr:hypothetical protein [Sedimentisphaerales bacterium]